MENKLVKISWQEMIFLHVTRLAKYFKGSTVICNLCFTLNLIQIIIEIVTIGCKSYIHGELCYTPLVEFFQSKLENKLGANGIGGLWCQVENPIFGTIFETFCQENSIQIRFNMERTYF